MRSSVVSVLAITVIGVGGGVIADRLHAPPVSVSKAAEAPPQVPVLAAKAQAQDVPILLRGLGTVAAYNTVALRSRVEGAITQINFKEGQEVHAGDVLIQLDPRPYQATLDQAKAQMLKDQAALSNAKVNLTRYGDLLKQDFTPQQQFDTQKTTVTQDEAAGASDTAAINAAQLNVDYTALRSPIDGVTGIRDVDIGNLIQANSGQTLVTITQIKPIFVIFTLPEADIGKVRRAMAKHPVAIEVYRSDDAKKVADGTLDLVNNAVDASTGTVQLKAEFKNENEALWPGEFVNAHVVLDTVHDGVTVPSSAVLTGPKGAYTYVVDGQSKAQVRPIAVEQTEANTALVSSGLKAGDQVITGGQFRLQAGSLVKVSDQIADGGQKLTDAPVGTDAAQ